MTAEEFRDMCNTVKMTYRLKNYHIIKILRVSENGYYQKVMGTAKIPRLTAILYKHRLIAYMRKKKKNKNNLTPYLKK